MAQPESRRLGSEDRSTPPSPTVTSRLSPPSLTSQSSLTLASPRPSHDPTHLAPYAALRSPAQDGGGVLHAAGSPSWSYNDPRSSSMVSLRPSHSSSDGRRLLLLVYIHGFLGSETSFKSFPAHVHNILTASLADTHVVHTKIYPRYKSRRNISYARDDFSNWCVALCLPSPAGANIPEAVSPRILNNRCRSPGPQPRWNPRGRGRPAPVAITE